MRSKITADIPVFLLIAFITTPVVIQTGDVIIILLRTSADKRPPLIAVQIGL